MIYPFNASEPHLGCQSISQMSTTLGMYNFEEKKAYAILPKLFRTKSNTHFCLLQLAHSSRYKEKF
jgi:hypothetical protein